MSTSAPTRKHQPKRMWLEKVANYALYLTSCALAATGFILAYRLPHGRDAREWMLFGMGRHDWGDWHLWLGFAFIALILLHLYFVRNWLIRIAVKRRRWLLLFSLAAGLVLILIALLAPVKKPSTNADDSEAISQTLRSGDGRGHGGRSNESR